MSNNLLQRKIILMYVLHSLLIIKGTSIMNAQVLICRNGRLLRVILYLKTNNKVHFRLISELLSRAKGRRQTLKQPHI